jgi:TPR repeat protein
LSLCNLSQSLIEEDDTQAARWYRLAAEQGYARAQYSLGRMYESGQGVPEDYVEAVRWYRLAAEQGYAVGPVLPRV